MSVLIDLIASLEKQLSEADSEAKAAQGAFFKWQQSEEKKVFSVFENPQSTEEDKKRARIEFDDQEMQKRVREVEPAFAKRDKIQQNLSEKVEWLRKGYEILDPTTPSQAPSEAPTVKPPQEPSDQDKETERRERELMDDEGDMEERKRIEGEAKLPRDPASDPTTPSQAPSEAPSQRPSQTPPKEPSDQAIDQKAKPQRDPASDTAAAAAAAAATGPEPKIFKDLKDLKKQKDDFKNVAKDPTKSRKEKEDALKALADKAKELVSDVKKITSPSGKSGADGKSGSPGRSYMPSGSNLTGKKGEKGEKGKKGKKKKDGSE